MSTLILQDVTLAINGQPEFRGDAGGHLVERIAEVRRMSPTDVLACFEVLEGSESAGDDADLEILYALTVVSLAHPGVAEERGVSAEATGRRFAARLERNGDLDGSLAVIERLREFFPSHQALERDYDAVLGRLGMVMDLAERYHDRAQSLLREGNNEEAIGWLREVLLLDSSRRDVARKIRDLRLEGSYEPVDERVSRAPMLATLLIGMSLALGVVRERSLLADFEELPTAVPQDYDSKRDRLEALETFIEAHPIWHGAFFAVAERSELRVEVGQLKIRDADQRDRRARELQASLEAAGLAHRRARASVGSENYSRALEYLEEALEVAPEDWDQRGQAERDIAAIREYMAEQPSTRNTE